MSLPARSCSRTPPHRTSLVRSHSHSVSSTHSPAAAPESPAGSGGKGHEYSKSTSQDGNGTDDESMAGSDHEAPLKMMNTKLVRVPTVQAPAAMSRKPRGLAVKWKDQPPRAAKVPQNPMVRCQSMQPHHRGRQGKTQLQKKPRPVFLAPPSCPLTLTARSLKQNRSVSNARMPGI